MFYLATPHAKTSIQSYELDSEKLDRNNYYAKLLEKNGFKIFLPMRDADQSLSGGKWGRFRIFESQTKSGAPVPE